MVAVFRQTAAAPGVRRRRDADMKPSAIASAIPHEAGTRAESDLIDAVRAGDGAAFDELVGRHMRRAFAVAYRLLGQRQDAEDVVQDGFLAALIRIETFEPQPPLRPLAAAHRRQSCDQHAEGARAATRGTDTGDGGQRRRIASGGGGAQRAARRAAARARPAAGSASAGSSSCSRSTDSPGPRSRTCSISPTALFDGICTPRGRRCEGRSALSPRGRHD